jgi:hypothetical protein
VLLSGELLLEEGLALPSVPTPGFDLILASGGVQLEQEGVVIAREWGQSAFSH